MVRTIGNIKNSKNGNMLEGAESFYLIRKGFFETFLTLNTSLTDCVKLYQAIRNTIHNSGIYFPEDKQDKTFTFQGNSYEFKNGCPVDFITWTFLKDLTIELIKLVGVALSHSAIISINEIKDPAAEIEWVEQP